MSTTALLCIYVNIVTQDQAPFSAASYLDLSCFRILIYFLYVIRRCILHHVIRVFS